MDETSQSSGVSGVSEKKKYFYSVYYALNHDKEIQQKEKN